MVTPDLPSLSAYISKCYDEAKSSKNEVTERLLKCERQRRGHYDPDISHLIAAQGGTDIYMMLTDVKCRAAESWIRDVMLSSDRTWTLSPTSEPSVPDNLRDGIVQMVTMEAMAAQTAGIPVDPMTIGIRLGEIHDEVIEKVGEEAVEAATRMQTRMDDILQEAGFMSVMNDLIYDFTTFPYCVLKGPVVRKKKKLTWSGAKPVVKEVTVRAFERVSPYDVFWSPNATDPSDGYFIERLKLSRASLSGMRGLPDVNNKELEAAIDAYRGGLREYLYSDTEEADLKGRSAMSTSSSDVIEGVNFWGSVPGAWLREWGMSDVDTHAEYEVNAWMVGRYVLMCKMNPDPLGTRPYSKKCWEAIPGAFAGKGLPELMHDVQAMCNAAARALANNMALASGPMAEVDVDRLAKGEQISNVVPWRIFQTTSDRSGGGHSAIRFFQPDMNAEGLLNVYTYFQRVADEVTGVPNYIYGSSAVSGAGRTASGLSMLMENAAKGIKSAILHLDEAVSETLERLYNHLMLFDKDPSIKADAQIIATGVVGTLMKDQINARRAEFLAATANPLDAQIVTPDRRAYLLREQAKTLNVDADKVVPDPEEVRGAMQAQQQAQPQVQE